MVKRKARRFRILRLEVDVSFPFPMIIGVFAAFIMIASYSLLGMPDFGLQFALPIGSIDPNSVGDLAAAIRIMMTHSIVVSTLNLFYVILLLVPLLMAFNFALGFSNGQIRMLVSYPIGRERIIVTKWGLIFILSSASVTLGALFGLAFFFPFTMDFATLGQLFIPLWINILLVTTSCLLMAVLFRSAPLTAVGGICLWLGTFVLLTMQSSSSFLLNVLFPFLSATNYLNHDFISPISFLGATSLSDVLLGCGAALLLSVLLLCFSVFAFRRLEV